MRDFFIITTIFFTVYYVIRRVRYARTKAKSRTHVMPGKIKEVVEFRDGYVFRYEPEESFGKWEQ